MFLLKYSKPFFSNKIKIVSYFFKKSYVNYSLIKNVSTFLEYYKNYSVAYNMVRNKIITNFTKSDLFNYSKGIKTVEDSINILFFTNFKKDKSMNVINSSQLSLKGNSIHRSFYFSKKKSFSQMR